MSDHRDLVKPPIWTRALGALLILLALLVVCTLPTHGQANVAGQWQTLPTLMPINPVHVALMHNGKVLIVSGSGNFPSDANYLAAVWDPQTNTVTTQSVPFDMFCNGMIVLPDGRPFIMGGTLLYSPPQFEGLSQTAAYDPTTGNFVELQSMAHGRWYPTATTLSDGSVMVFSGLDESDSTNTTVEIYKVGSGWSQPFGAGWTPPLYPRMHLLPNGTVFYSGPSASSAIFNSTTHTWTTGVATTNYGGTRTYGSSVLLPLMPANNYDPRVMIMGGDNPANATTEIIDLGASHPQWVFGPSMSEPRIEMDAVILPNGKVLALNGSTSDEDANTASLNADLYDPNTNTFSSAGVATYPRLYHSGALLLPNATVLVLGGNPVRGTYEPHLEIYTPAYLFNSDGSPATQPTITSVTPGVIGYGGSFQIQTPNAANISSIVLVRAGSPTHAFDMDQRLVGLNFTTGNGVLNATAPPNGSIAPPGYYLLFILNSAGVPSVAQFVKLSLAPTDQPPTGIITSPSSNVTINPGQSVSFQGTGTSANSTIAAYSWMFPGGNPTSSSLANPGAVTYPTSAPVITSENPTAGPVGTLVTITAAPTNTYVASLTVTDSLGVTDPSPPTRTITMSGGFGSSQGTSTVTFNGVTATPTSWTASSITVPVPSGATSGSIVVTAGGVASNGVGFTVTTSTPPPAITSLSPTSGPVGTAVTITGTYFGSSGTVRFNGTTATTTNWNSTTIVTSVPAGATSGNVVVTVGGVASNTIPFTVTSSPPPPSITSLSTTSGPVGTAVTITGTNFGSSGTVRFNGTTATTASWTSTSIATSVPTGATSGNVVVTVGGVASNGVPFTVTTSGSPTINYGSGFTAGGLNLLGSAKLNGTALRLTDGNSNEAGAAWYGTQVNIQSFTTDFTFLISGGTNPTADGFTFAIQGENSSALGNLGGALGYGPSTSGASGIPTSVAVKFDLYSNNGEGVDSTGLYTDGAWPTTPAVDMSGSGVNLHSGDPFHVHMSYDGTNLVMTITDTTTNGSFSNTWPINIPTTVGGNVAYVGFTGGSGGLTAIQDIQTWTLTNASTSAPAITSLSPTSGPVGTAVTITGTNFGTSGTVRFNGTTATTTSWTSTSIATSVPAGATSGNVVVTVAGVASNGIAFTVTSSAPPPSITSLSPTSGLVGTAVTITGTNFGSSGTVRFNGTTATTASWTSTSIATSVPTGATSGNVVVTVGGVASNGVPFTVTTSGSPTINYGSGFTAGGLNLLGSAKLNGTALRLTDGNSNEAGAAWYGTQVNIQSFTTDFTFLISGGTNPTADGFTFAIQGENSSALGNLGGALGYGPSTSGASGIPTSVAVKFDLYSNNGEGVDSTGLYTDGAWPTTPAVDMSGSGVNLHSGDPFHVHMSYDGTNLVMTITDTTTNGSFSNTWPINIPTTVGGNVAYVGFTGGSGGLTAIQDIQTWTLTNASTSAPAITSTSSTTFTVGTAGSFTVTATGSPTPSLTESGALPSGVTFVNNGNGTATLSGTPASGTAGTYTFTITASNGVGTAATQSFTLKVNQAPAITSTSSTTFTVGTAGSFTVTATGSPTPSLTESGALPSGVTFVNNGNGTATLSGTPASGTAGTYTFTITASNGVGTAATQSFTLTVSAASTAPAITSTSSTTFTVGTAGSFTVTATGSPTPSLTESGALPSGVTFVNNGNGTATLSGAPASGTAGTYTFTITASNGVGTAATQTFTLKVNQAPAITSTSSTTFTVGTAGSFTVTATGSPTPSLTESGALPSGVTFVNNGNGTATLSGTPASGTAGTYTFTITASNGVGTAATQSFTLKVNQAPAITSTSSTTFTVGTAGSFTVTATGSPTPSLTESGALPSGVTFVNNGNGTATLSGTPASGTAGTYTFTITASNGVGTAATQTFTLTVNGGTGGGGIKLVQHTSIDAGTTNSFSLAFPSGNTAGNWIAVCIRAGAENETFTVTDTRGNTYRKAIQFTETGDGNTIGIFYAENIAGGANTVKVSDTTADTLRYAILEYSGVATSGSLDVVAVTQQGDSTSPSSGTATTTANGDLLLGVVMTGNPETFTAGTRYRIEESVPAEPGTKWIAEDQIQATAGAASASATLGGGDFWAAGLAAFKAGP